MSLPVYRPSLRFDPARMFASTVVGFSAAAVIGYYYAIFEIWLTRALASAAVTALLGLALAGIATGISRVGKVRHPGLNGLIGLCAGAITLYFSWGSMLTHRAQEARARYSYFILDPRPIVGAFAAVGNPARLIWIGEALLLVGLPTLGGLRLLRGQAFCEPCDAWIPAALGVRKLASQEPDAVVRRLQGGDLSHVLSEQVLASTREAFRMSDSNLPAVHYHLDLHRCPSCRQSAYVQLVRITRRKDDKGNVSHDRRALTELLQVAPEHAEVLGQG